MANGLNKAILIGNLGRDPEVRYTPSGVAVANFSIATSESWTNKDGEKETRTIWEFRFEFDSTYSPRISPWYQ